MNFSWKIITFGHVPMTSDGNTERAPLFIEKLDPRVKFISLALLSLQIFAFRPGTPLIVASIVLTIAVIAARTSVSFLLKRLLSLSFFIVVIVIFNTFTGSGDVLFEFAGVYATREGFQKGLVLSARLALLLFAATVFVQTTSIAAMIDSIEATLRPVRPPFRRIVQVLTIALNFVPMLVQSAQHMKRAQIARGARIDRNILRQLGFAFSAVVPLFAMTLRSSEQLALAMESRCFDPSAERSHYSKLRTGPQDWITLFVIVVQFVVSRVLAA